MNAVLADLPIVQVGKGDCQSHAHFGVVLRSIPAGSGTANRSAWDKHVGGVYISGTFLDTFHIRI